MSNNVNSYLGHPATYSSSVELKSDFFHFFAAGGDLDTIAKRIQGLYNQQHTQADPALKGYYRHVLSLLCSAKEAYYQTTLKGKISLFFRTIVKRLFGAQNPLERAQAALHEMHGLPFMDFDKPAEIQCDQWKALKRYVRENYFTLCRCKEVDQPFTLSKFPNCQFVLTKGGGFYVIFMDQQLGSGADKIVYKGLNAHTGEVIAYSCTRIQEDPQLHSETVADAARGVRQSKLLEGSPYVLKIHYSFSTHQDGKEQVVQITPFVAGKDLCKGYLHLSDKKKAEKWTQAQKQPLMKKMICAVQHMHGKGILHRDIQPKNILIDESGGELTPIFIDFDHSCSVRERKELKKFCGTESFLPPEYCQKLLKENRELKEQEQWASTDMEEATSFQKDSWALGLVLISLYTGVVFPTWPDRGYSREKMVETIATLQEGWVDSDLPKKYANDPVVCCLKRLLHPDPEKRASLEDVLEALEILEDENVAETVQFKSSGELPDLIAYTRSQRELWKKTAAEQGQSVAISYPSDPERLFVVNPQGEIYLVFLDERNCIGRGATSEAHRGFRLDNREMIASLRNRASEGKKRVNKNAQFLLSLKEIEYVPTVYATVNNDDKAMTLMPLRNGDLFDHARKYKGGKHESDRFFVYHLLRAVQEIHEKKVINRDLKLENILMQPLIGPSLHLPCIGDFDLATSCTDELAMSKAVGTPDYIAPEYAGALANGRPIKDVTSTKLDDWAVGMTLYQFWYKKNPVPLGRLRNNSDNARDAYYVFRSEIPEEWFDQNTENDPVGEIIKGLLQPDPNKRLTVAEALKRLERAS